MEDPDVSCNAFGIERGLFGIDFVLNSSILDALELVRQVRELRVKNVTNVADNRLVIGIIPAERINKISLGQLENKDLGSHGKILGVIRDATFQAASEINRFYESDDIIICTEHDWFHRTCKRFSDTLTPNQVHIIGGGSVGTEVAALLLQEGTKVTVIETNQERCVELSNKFSSVTVVRGDGTDIKLLNEEGIQSSGVFIATAPQDEVNLMATLLAKEMGVENTLALTHRPDHSVVYSKLGISGTTGFHKLLMGFLESEFQPGMLNRAQQLGESNFNIVEFEIKGCGSRKLNGQELSLPQSCFLLGTAKAEKVQIGGSVGTEVYQEGDSLIFIAQDSQQKDLEKTIKKWASASQ